jgi:hypothetical protein
MNWLLIVFGMPLIGSGIMTLVYPSLKLRTENISLVQRLYHVRDIIREDRHWMEHNPIVDKLTLRYLDAYSEDLA